MPQNGILRGAKVEVYAAAVLLSIIAVVGVYDFWAGFSNRSVATISEVVYRWSQLWPIIPLLVGLVLGHLFWPTRGGATPPGPSP